LEVYASNLGGYAIVVHLVRTVSITKLIQNLQSQSVGFTYASALERVKSSFKKRHSTDVQIISSSISLQCQLGKYRIMVPVRANTCRDHLQCFDLQTYLQMNKRTPTWLCPVCSGKAGFQDLFVDTYFQKVLSEVPSDINEVEIQPDGTWCPAKQPLKKRKAEVQLNRVNSSNNTAQPVVIDLTADNDDFVSNIKTNSPDTNPYTNDDETDNEAFSDTTSSCGESEESSDFNGPKKLKINLSPSASMNTPKGNISSSFSEWEKNKRQSSSPSFSNETTPNGNANTNNTGGNVQNLKSRDSGASSEKPFVIDDDSDDNDEAVV